MKKNYTMRALQLLPFFLGLVVASVTGLATAQSTAAGAPAPLTRAQVKMERDEFLKSHTFNPVDETWQLKPGFEAPSGVKTRAEIRAERDEYMRNNRYDAGTQTWIPLKGTPRDLGSMTRAQMREETKQFIQTHRWDEASNSWMDKPPARIKK